MEDVGGMVHTFLKGTVKMGECFRTASKAKVFAEIVAAFGAIRATIAHDASLNGDSLTLHQMCDAGTNSSHDAGGFMTKD